MGRPSKDTAPMRHQDLGVNDNIIEIMHQATECLNRRYKVLDDIIKELSIASHKTIAKSQSNTSTSNAGIKLMCDFWNILQEDPNCNLTEEVQHRMGTGVSEESESKRTIFHPRQYVTYLSDRCNSAGQNKKPVTPKPSQPCCSGSCSKKSNDPMLTKVLCNLKQAANFDKRCHKRVKQLMDAQEELANQIKILEKKEKEGAELMKQADSMWLSMEESYKQKIRESINKQNSLLKPLKEVEESANKWRKNKKDLEFQIENMKKAKMEIIENMNHKKNEIKLIDAQNENLEKRIQNAKNDIEISKKAMCSQKLASDARIAKLVDEINKVQKRTDDEKKHLKDKENEGSQYVKDARADLQKICKVLIQKRIENEDLKAEKTGLLGEISILNASFDSCKDRCANKQKSVADELNKLTEEIKTFQLKCTHCHEGTDTNDVRRFCTDCPRCLEERSCKIVDDQCIDPKMDCVCMSVKQKFLDNIFDNMYTVLERQAKTRPGKAVATAILDSLKKSRNGKLCRETRKLLQEFILTTVKKHLNLTIVGGAVKTRCEMEPETYKELMNCLKSITVSAKPKADKSTPTKKEPCSRWSNSGECHCPHGPENCICTRKALKPYRFGTPIPSDPDDEAENVKSCPHKDPKKVCSVDCSAQGASPDFGFDIASWRPDPCAGKSCPYGKNPKTAPVLCDFGSRLRLAKHCCTCRDAGHPCKCFRDGRFQPRQQIIEEFMGRYDDVPLFDKVSFAVMGTENVCEQ